MKGLEDMLGVQWGRRERTLLEGWGTAFPESVLRPTLPGPNHVLAGPTRGGYGPSCLSFPQCAMRIK